MKLIQKTVSLPVNILNWHNQPKIHCFSVRKWQIKQEHTHPQNLVINLSGECFLSPWSIHPVYQGILYYFIHLYHNHTLFESLVLSQKWEFSISSFLVPSTEPTLIKPTEIEAINSTAFTLGWNYLHIKFCSNLNILITSFLNLVWT